MKRLFTHFIVVFYTLSNNFITFAVHSGEWALFRVEQGFVKQIYRLTALKPVVHSGLIKKLYE